MTIISKILGAVGLEAACDDLREGQECRQPYADMSEGQCLHWQSLEYPMDIDVSVFELLVDCGRL